MSSMLDDFFYFVFSFSLLVGIEPGNKPTDEAAESVPTSLTRAVHCHATSCIFTTLRCAADKMGVEAALLSISGRGYFNKARAACNKRL